ncbi:MAG: PEGA domain-containing protein [Acidobacteria bacterium]|nr:PEGA domain-containing protein [Acidobacteriota bacterium]
MLERDVETVPDLAGLKMLFYRLEAVSQQAPDHPDVRNGVARVKQRILARGLELKQAGGAIPSPSPTPATPYPATPQPPVAGTQPWATPQPYPPASAPPQTPVPAAFPSASLPVQPAGPPPLDYPAAPPQAAPPAAPPPAGGAMWKRALLVGGAIGLVAFGGIVFMLRKTVQKPATPSAISVDVRTTPAGAQIRVNNEAKCTSNCKVDLAPGAYQVQAVLDGFEIATATLNVALGAPAALSLILQPSPLQVKLFADLENGQVLLNDQPAGELQQGQFVLEKVPAGQHTIKVTGRGGEATLSLTVTPGQAPVVGSPIAVKNFLAVVVSGSGSEARIHTSKTPIKVALDGQPAGETAADGLALRNLRTGDHELTLGEGSDQRKLVLSFTPAPMLTAFLKLDLNAGTLVISAGEDEAIVYLNGKAYPGMKTRRGQLRIPALPVREYAVRVAKEGFQDVPEQKVQIRKGEETRIEFKMAALPKVAGLRLRGAVPGAQVFLDGNNLGRVYSDGAFLNSSVPPGEHVIELRRERYTPKQIRREFKAGETLELSGADLGMEVMPGILRLNITPAGARILIKRSDEAQPRMVRETTLRLPEGIYTIAVAAAGFQDNIVTVQLVAGETKDVTLSLTAVKSAAAPAAPAAPPGGGMNDWDDPKAWQQDGPWLVRKGGSFVTYKTQPARGVFEFKAARLKGRRLRYFVNYRDARNYCLFELDGRRFYRTDVVNGKAIELAKIDHRVESENEFRLRIDIAPTSVTQYVQRSGKWETLDTWTESGRNFTAGKFGFRIDGSDQVGLAGFSFRAR